MSLLPMFPSMSAVRHCQLLLHHRWRRYQARTMALQLCGPDRQKQLSMLHARLRAMGSPAFRGLRLVAFGRASRMAARNGRYTADVGINDADCLIHAIRCAKVIVPDYAGAIDTAGQSRRRQGILIHPGPPGPHSRMSVNLSDICDNLTGRSPHDALTGGQLPMFYSDPPRSINTSGNTSWRVG